MRFVETKVAGALVIEPEPVEDGRGFFARLVDVDEFRERGLSADFVQCSVSFNRRRGTLRGLHYQAAPGEEAKLVRCTMGRIFDVVVDLRSGDWFGVELSATNRRALYVPPGCAHGFQTLEDDSEVFYQITKRYDAELARGIRWDDPELAIEWPHADERVMSERDRSAPRFAERE
jgi:dTDP-4-dehydrorhamnose 3,5-epimerase